MARLVCRIMPPCLPFLRRAASLHEVIVERLYRFIFVKRVLETRFPLLLTIGLQLVVLLRLQV